MMIIIFCSWDSPRANFSTLRRRNVRSADRLLAPFSTLPPSNPPPPNRMPGGCKKNSTTEAITMKASNWLKPSQK